jgi:alpha-mannosidase
MHETTPLIERRVGRTYRERILPATYRHRVPVEVTAWTVPGEPVPFDGVPEQQFAPLHPGEAWGRPWGTTWLRLAGEVPAGWPAGGRVELVVDLGFQPGTPGFQAEGLAWTAGGRVLKAVAPRNAYVPLDARPGEPVTVFVEAASNPDVGADWSFRPTDLGDLATAGQEPLYRFGGAWLCSPDDAVRTLERDWWTLQDLLGVLPADSPRRARVVRALERATDVLDPDDVPGTAGAARAELAAALRASAAPTSHRIAATGHAHIDCAWLWPVRETVRKCARTFANVLSLMDDYPDFVFAASSAQQYAWMKEHYPQLFARIRDRVREGRWIPVGGMWVESDTNMPGGEAMVRQFLAGHGFFSRELGVEPREVWLPDSFGYSAALPQIVAGVGAEFFLTQKTSWNETNRMPHHTFLWEGIDGSRVLTHFPPVDTYNSDLSAADLARAERQHAERGLSDASLVPFGYGDGGGGPTREMLEVGLRKRDLEGSPRVAFTRPDRFFEAVRDELAAPAVWSGELYLEVHRGTYTSQARTKEGNRRCEHLLREAELWSATAAVRAGAAYPAEALGRAWETVLLQQFHDILPGSSIAWVHREAERRYRAVADDLEALIAAALDALAGRGDGRTGREGAVAFNASPFAVAGVPALGAGRAAPDAPVTVRPDGDAFVLESAALTARFDALGRLTSLVDRATGREAVPAGEYGNELRLYRDIPTRWDAWDLDAAYTRTPVGPVEVDSVRAAGTGLEIVRHIRASTVRQHVRLSTAGTAVEIETTVDWQEKQKLLKLAFPWDVHADSAASEIQFGHVRRAVHANTSWDMARFETSAHRWVRVEEPDFGVTVANDRVYGHDVTRHTRPGGGTTTVVRESLLRAPLFPDPGADQGRHVFRHSLVPGPLLPGIAEGYRLNLPLRHAAGAPVEPLVSMAGDGVLVEGLKLAEDGSGDVVVRLYEARGRQVRARLEPRFPTAGAVRTDLLERPLPEQPPDPLDLRLRAFEIATIRLPRTAAA